MAGKIQKLSIAKPIKMVHGSGGMVLASETVEIPMGYVGVLSVRRSYGNNKLFITSQFLDEGFNGQPELHLLNQGNDLELPTGKQLVNLVILKAL